MTSRPPDVTNRSRRATSGAASGAGARTTSVEPGLSLASAIEVRSWLTGCPARCSSAAQPATPSGVVDNEESLGPCGAGANASATRPSTRNVPTTMIPAPIQPTRPLTVCPR